MPCACCAKDTSGRRQGRQDYIEWAPRKAHADTTTAEERDVDAHLHSGVNVDAHIVSPTEGMLHEGHVDVLGDMYLRARNNSWAQHVLPLARLRRAEATSRVVWS